ncbi:MAG: DUF1653 domain-containing protein [Patescibacteria group bacterium]
MEEVIPNRIYSHYRGGKFLVLFVSDDSTNSRPGNRVVVYVSLTYGKVKSRDLSEFLEVVEWPDGQKRNRFVLAE